jgi:endogenous inhibitor of DNA gyrase (YacG/DUF329 family)
MRHKMFRLVIRCPETGKPIRLKMEMDKKTFTGSGFRNIRTQCPHCQHLHIWQKADASLEPITAPVQLTEAPVPAH